MGSEKVERERVVGVIEWGENEEVRERERGEKVRR